MKLPKQNTKEWLEWRRTVIGASDAPIIMGVSPWKDEKQLLEEKLGLIESNYSSYAMQRGHDLEPIARNRFEIEIDDVYFPSVVVHPEYKWMAASLDGINLVGDSIVEIKCPGKDDHITAKNGNIPDKYYPQLQHQLAVTGLDMAYYYSFDGQDGVTIKVPRDQSYIDKMIDKEKAFYDKMMSAATNSDSENILMKKLAYIYEQTQEAYTKYNDLKKEGDSLIKELEQTSDKDFILGEKISIKWYERKGSVDYSKISELKNIDLEKYRKPSSKIYKINFIDKKSLN